MTGASSLLEESGSESSQPGSPHGAALSSHLQQRQQRRDGWGHNSAAAAAAGHVGPDGIAEAAAAAGRQNSSRVGRQVEQGRQLLSLSSRMPSMHDHLGDSDAILERLRSEKQQLQQHISEVAAEKFRTEAQARELARQNEQLQSTLQDTLKRSAPSTAPAADPASDANSKTEKKLVKYSKQLQKEKTRYYSQHHLHTNP